MSRKSPQRGLYTVGKVLRRFTANAHERIGRKYFQKNVPFLLVTPPFIHREATLFRQTSYICLGGEKNQTLFRTFMDIRVVT